MCLTCLPAPITAYANSYDFIRQSSCVGVWEHYPSGDKHEGHPQAPVDALRFDGERRREWCVRSSDNLFPWLVARLHHKGDTMHLREVGAVKIVTALALFAWCLAQDMAVSLRLGIAVAGLLTFGDMAILGYFDTLYTETIDLVLGFVLAVLLTGLAVRPGVPGRWWTLGFGLCVLAAGLGRQQYVPLAVGCGLAAAFLLARRRDGRAALLLALLALAVVPLQGALNRPRPGLIGSIDHANRMDTIMGAVLPAAPDRAAALATLGLPPACAAAIGRDWYTPAEAVKPACPQVYGTSRLRLAALFVTQPATFFRPLITAAGLVQPFLLPNVGHFEVAWLADSARVRLLQATSLSTWVDALPARVVAWGLLGALDVALACAAALFFVRASAARGALWLIATGGLVGFYAVVSSVFGDGYFEMSRHAVGVLIGLSLQIGGIVTASGLICSRSR